MMSDEGPESVDRDAALKLLSALEQDLDRLRGQGGSTAGQAEIHAKLAAELSALRAALHADSTAEARERLHGMRRVIEEGEVEVVRGAQYIAEIGRMLGM